jgi:hypothetical protein
MAAASRIAFTLSAGINVFQSTLNGPKHLRSSYGACYDEWFTHMLDSAIALLTCVHQFTVKLFDVLLCQECLYS